MNAKRYLALLRKKVVPCLREKDVISIVIVIQDGATSHITTPVKEYLIQIFEENRLISRSCKFPWPLHFPDLTPADFWLWGYLKSSVCRSRSSSLSELKDEIWREVAWIQPELLHCAVVVVMWNIYRCNKEFITFSEEFCFSFVHLFFDLYTSVPLMGYFWTIFFLF